MLLFGLLFAAGTLALVIQKCFAVPPLLAGMDWALLPLIVIYGTFFLTPAGAWSMALLLGLMTDLMSESRLGSSTLCLLAMTFLLQSQDLERLRSRWYAQMFLVLVGTMFYLLADYTLFCVQQRTLPFNGGLEGLLHKMTLSSLFNAIIAPLAFGLLNIALHSFGYRLPTERGYRDY